MGSRAIGKFTSKGHLPLNAEISEGKKNESGDRFIWVWKTNNSPKNSSL